MNSSGYGTGKVIRIAGPVVRAAGLEHVRLYDVVRVGELGLIGEVIRLSEGSTTIQVYEDTSGIRVGEPVHSTGLPLVVELGPGLLGQVYDGLQRPLEALAASSGEFVQRDIYATPIPVDKRWHFTPKVSVGDLVGPGDILGVVPESRTIEHRVMVPPHRRNLGFVFQDLALWPHLTVRENLDFVLGSGGTPRAERSRRAQELLALVRVGPLADRYPHQLSGGERNRVHLARMLKEGANLIILDEPTNDLDVNTLRALEEGLENFAGCAVISSHDRWFLDRIATHILAFEGDSNVVWFEGNYSDYEADRKKRLGKEADHPHRIRYRKLTRQ